MTKPVICICDENLDYLQLVQKYLLKRKLNNMEILMFSDLEKLKAHCSSKKVFLVLISENLADNNIEELECEKIWILQERKTYESTYPCISKYQSMDRILELLLGEIPQNSYDEIRKTHIQILTFFKTNNYQKDLTGFMVSKFLSNLGRKVLYLNFSPFEKFDFLQSNEAADITDLIFYLLKESDLTDSRIELLKKEKDNVDFVLPARDFNDLLELTRKDWNKIIERLKQQKTYDTIIIESNAVNRGIMEIYDNSVMFYMKADDSGREQFIDMLVKREGQKINKISVYDRTDSEYWKQRLTKDGVLAHD